MPPQVCENWLESYLMQVCKPCHYDLVKSVEPFKLHPMSMTYIYERFKCLHRLGMGVWLGIHIITTTFISPELPELSEILPDASVQTMPLQIYWGCRIFQTASHIHVIHLWEVWMHSQVVDGHTAIHSASTDLWKLAEIQHDASVQTMQLCFCWCCWTFQTAFHVHVIHIWEIQGLSPVMDGHMALHSHCDLHRRFPRFVRVGWNPTWCKCGNHATAIWLRLYNLSNCIPCPCRTYMRCLSTFSGYGWAYGIILTPLPPQSFPQICESWMKSYLLDASVQTMPLRFGWGCRTFQNASHVHVIHICSVWAPC